MSCNCDQILAGLNQIENRQKQNYPYLKKEIQKLQKRLAELEAASAPDGLTPTQKKQVLTILGVEVPGLVKPFIEATVAAQTINVIKPFVRASGAAILSQADRNAGAKIKAATNSLKAAVNTLSGKVSAAQSSIKGLGGRIASNGKKIVNNSKTLSRVSGIAKNAFGKANTLFTKLAPIFGIVGFLLNLAGTIGTAVALSRLFSRMTAQEKAMALLKGALTFAGGQLLTAAYVAALNRKVVGLEAQQKVDTQRIIGHISSKHQQTQGKVQTAQNINVVQHERTRQNTFARTSKTNQLIGDARAANKFEHQTTRERFRQVGDGIKQTVSKSAAKTQSLLGNYYRNIMAAIAGIGSGIATQVNALVSPQLQAILDVANDTRNKLIDKFQKTWDFLKMDRVLNAISTAASIHNAAMLSRNLTASLIDSISGTLSIIGLKDAEGNPFDLNSIIGSSAQSFVVSIIGQQAYDNLSDTWIKSNRIISAGAAVVMAVRSAQWAIAEGVEIIGNWIAKIGNGLREGGAVNDKQWPWMKEGIKIKQFSKLEKFNQGLESAEEITNQIYGTVAAGAEIGETVNSVRTAKDQFDQTLEQETTTADTEFDQRTSESESPDIDPLDLVRIEE